MAEEIVKQYTRSEVRAAREKWANFQATRGRKKTKGQLDRSYGERCCLGHACYVLGAVRNTDGLYIGYGKEKETSFLPEEIMNLLGTWDHFGTIIIKDREVFRKPKGSEYNGKYKNYYFDSLADLNDHTDISAVQIGKYLKTVIEGGYGTPFRPLEDFKE